MIKSNQTKQWLRFLTMGFPDGSVVKNLPPNAGDSGHPVLTPGLDRSPGEGSGNPLQYSCLENLRDRGAWRATQSMGSQRVRHNWAQHSTQEEQTWKACWKHNLGNVTGEAGTGNNNTVSDGEFHPVITGLQQRASHFQEFYKMIIKHSHLCNWP